MVGVGWGTNSHQVKTGGNFFCEAVESSAFASLIMPLKGQEQGRWLGTA